MIILDTCTVCEKNWDEAGLLFNCEECMGDHSYCQTHRIDHEHKIIENIEHVQIKPVYQENQNRGGTIPNRAIWNMPFAWTSGNEWRDLLIASIVMIFLFIIRLLIDISSLIEGNGFRFVGGDSQFLGRMITVVIIVGVTFVIHELSHKYVAISFGHNSRFVLNILYIAISLITVALNLWFTFIWVGAAMVMSRTIIGHEMGKIAAAGPYSNLVMGSIGIIFVLIFQNLGVFNDFIFGVPLNFILGTFIFMNGFIGGFNMLPFGPLDGLKVWRWNKFSYFSLTSGLFILFIIGLMI